MTQSPRKPRAALRSQQWFGRQDRDGFAYRSWLKGKGIPHDQFDGRPVIGICNGFQIACEAHLLPGALLRNDRGYRAIPVTIRVEQTNTPFTAAARVGQCLTMPIAHGEGRYTMPANELDRLEGEGRVAFRYAEAVNGSARNIAGAPSDTRVRGSHCCFGRPLLTLLSGRSRM